MSGELKRTSDDMGHGIGSKYHVIELFGILVLLHMYTENKRCLACSLKDLMPILVKM